MHKCTELLEDGATQPSQAAGGGTGALTWATEQPGAGGIHGTGSRIIGTASTERENRTGKK